MQLSARLHHPQGDSDEEGDDKGDAHTQIEGVLTKAAWVPKVVAPTSSTPWRATELLHYIIIYNYIYL